MSWYPGLNPLRDVLADLYPAASIARVVVTEASIAESLVDFSGAAVEFWKSILTTAHHNGQVQALIDVARTHFPNNAQLAEAERVFLETPVPRLPGSPSGQDAGSNTTLNVDGTNSGIIVGGDVQNSKIQNVGAITGTNNRLGQ